jgi:PiT family inorganic phosphate transporter
MNIEYVIIFTIALALIFDFINGFHDAANSIATVVSTRVLRPQWAVVWAAFFNFIAFLFFDLKVANTVGKGVIDPAIIDVWIIMAALIGSIIWNLVTWYFGLPSSSSHALIGGLIGAAVMKSGHNSLNVAGLSKILISIVASPFLGMFLGFAIMSLSKFLVQNKAPAKVNGIFQKLQLVSAALYSLGHGGNDAQKTMGIIAVLLFSTGHLGAEFHVPLWIVLSCHVAMGLGTLAGGWRIVKTMGMKLTRLRTIGGFSAETGGAMTLFLATKLGIPVSTTHTVTGAILGVGSVSELRKVRWKTASRIIWAWIFTIPASAIISGLWWMLIH